MSANNNYYNLLVEGDALAEGRGSCPITHNGVGALPTASLHGVSVDEVSGLEYHKKGLGLGAHIDLGAGPMVRGDGVPEVEVHSC